MGLGAILTLMGTICKLNITSATGWMAHELRWVRHRQITEGGVLRLWLEETVSKDTLEVFILVVMLHLDRLIGYRHGVEFGLVYVNPRNWVWEGRIL